MVSPLRAAGLVIGGLAAHSDRPGRDARLELAGRGRSRPQSARTGGHDLQAELRALGAYLQAVPSISLEAAHDGHYMCGLTVS